MNIRPLAAFKKQNPEPYKKYLERMKIFELQGGSKKQQENNFYYVYAFFSDGIEKGTHESPNPFLLDKKGSTRNNVTTVTELGRLLLTGWYYNLEEFAKQICGYIDRIYNNTAEQDRPLISGLMTEAINHLRDNLQYYAQNSDQMKLYLLQTLAKDEIARLEPEKPEKLALVDEIIEMRKAFNLKHDKEYFIKLADNQEAYIEYLQEELDKWGIGYLSFEDKMKAVDEELKPFYEEIATLDKEHQAKLQAAALGNKLLS